VHSWQDGPEWRNDLPPLPGLHTGAALPRLHTGAALPRLHTGAALLAPAHSQLAQFDNTDFEQTEAGAAQGAHASTIAAGRAWSAAPAARAGCRVELTRIAPVGDYIRTAAVGGCLYAAAAGDSCTAAAVAAGHLYTAVIAAGVAGSAAAHSSLAGHRVERGVHTAAAGDYILLRRETWCTAAAAGHIGRELSCTPAEADKCQRRDEGPIAEASDS